MTSADRGSGLDPRGAEPRQERNLLSLRKPVAASVGTARITSSGDREGLPLQPPDHAQPPRTRVREWALCTASLRAQRDAIESLPRSWYVAAKSCYAIDLRTVDGSQTSGIFRVGTPTLGRLMAVRWFASFARNWESSFLSLRERNLRGSSPLTSTCVSG